MKKIKILVDGISTGIGGIGSVIISILERIDRNLFDIDVLFTYNSVYEPIVNELGFGVKKITPFGKNVFKYKKELENIFKDEKYDYVWINNTGKTNVIIFELAKKYDAKTISHSHGETQEYRGVKKILMPILNQLNQNKFYKNLDIALSCSDTSAKYFYNERKMKGKQITILENAVDVYKYEFNREFRDKYRSEFKLSDSIVVGMVGRLCEVKNQRLMLKVFEALKNDTKYKLVIVGDGSLKDEYLSIIKQYGIENNVMLLGARRDVPRILSAFDAYVLPSVSEGYCVSVIEAYANGLECLVSDTVKNPKFNKIKYLNINNVDDWINAVRDLTIRKDESSDNIKELLTNGNDISSMVKKFEDLIICDSKKL